MAALFILGGLIGGQPGAARRVAVLDMDRPAGRGAVGDLLPAASAIQRSAGNRLRLAVSVCREY